MINISSEQKIKLISGFKIAILAFLVALGVSLLIENIRIQSNKPENTITFSGHGEINAVPDIANIYFNISKDAKTVKEAQALVAGVEKKSLDFLKENNILEKDIKTADASFYPKYEYKQAVCPPMPVGSTSSAYYCPPSKQVISGYTASESITVKIRNTDDVGKIMQGLGALDVSNLSGPNFAIDKEEGLKATARKKAIDDAKAKAKVLAKDLGIRLGKIVSFNENGNYPAPMYDSRMMSAGVSAKESLSAQLPKGENTITSDISITYEIR